jgi:quercetin dioxygenase-like cupin family protein
MPHQTHAAPIHRLEEAETLAFVGEVLAIRLTSEQTGGVVAAMEHLLSRGTATPLHVHAGEAELLHVIEGELTVWQEGALSHAAAGDLVWLPAGAPHAFRVDSERARVLALSLPGGHERYFRLAGDPAATLDLAAVGTQPPDTTRMAAAAAEAGVEILGPPPFEDG